jgi:hypothetical protein
MKKGWVWQVKGDAPPLPEPDAEGNRPAFETVGALIAREIIERRKRAGLTQFEL